MEHFLGFQWLLSAVFAHMGEYLLHVDTLSK